MALSLHYGQYVTMTTILQDHASFLIRVLILQLHQFILQGDK